MQLCRFSCFFLFLLLCRRWGEENLIKELLLKHLINYSPGYVFEELEEQPMVDNPEIKQLKKEKAGILAKIKNMQQAVKPLMVEREELTRQKDTMD